MKECPACKRCFPDEINHCPQDGDATTPTLPGEPIIDGRYKLEKRLGQGGMGVVFQARHTFLKTSHAIKVILPDLVGNDPMLVTRFRQEALAAAAIRHQNIITVTDFGVLRGTMPFLVMEFVSGKSLQDILSEEKRMSAQRALAFISAIGAGVSEAHRQNIVHRDLKPLNIIVRSDVPLAEGVKILDFGLAKIKSGELLGSFVQAKTSGLMGSPFYMAPEQWSDEEPDSRADVYSLGIILYQMLSGDVPFKGSSIPSIMKKHLTLPPPSFKSVGVEVPPRVVAAVFHALEKDVNARTPTVEAFLAELGGTVESGRSTSVLRHDFPETSPKRPVSEDMPMTSTPYQSSLGSSSYPPLSAEESEKISAARLARARQEEERVRLRREEREARERLTNEKFWRDAYARREEDKERERRRKEEEEQANRDRAEREELESQRHAEVAHVKLQGREMDRPRARTPNYLDDNAQFTVYKPKKIRPQQWYSLLAYAHLSEPRPGEDEADPTKRMEAEVKGILGEQRADSYVPVSEESAQSIPRGGEITFAPLVPGIEFNPPSHSFYWFESVHGQEFRMRASAALEGKTVRGRMSVFLGAIVLAEINLTLRVAGAGTVELGEVPLVKEKPARPYRKVFPSYSHKDREIVAQIAHYAEVTGDKYMLDMYELRSGQNWKHWMYDAIEEADIFQLFWSTNSMRSQNVKLEWQHALFLNRENFIRPTYWENPLPKSPSDNLPPPELLDLHFYQIQSPVSVSVGGVALPVGEETKPAAPRAQDKYEPQGRAMVAGGKLEREIIERRRAAQEAERNRKEEEERVNRERAEREERERQQREQIQRVERQAREMEERLERLSQSLPTTRVTIDPEATQMQQGSSSGPLSWPDPPPQSMPTRSSPVGLPMNSPKQNRTPILIIGAVFAVIGLIIGLIVVLLVIAKS